MTGLSVKAVANICLLIDSAAYLAFKKLHHWTILKTHRYMLGRFDWYAEWNELRYAKHFNLAASFSMFMLLLVILLHSASLLLAYDLSQSWNFSTPSQYTTDSGAEVASSTARLKALEYSADSNTAALYHCNDGSGSAIADSSGNGNNLTFANSAFTTGNLNGACSFNGTSAYGSTNDSASLDLTGANSIEAWTKFSSAFSANSSETRAPIVDKGTYKLYYDHQTGKITYELAQANTNSWTQQAGPTGGNYRTANSSWDDDLERVKNNPVWIGSNMYVGFYGQTGMSEVWKWNGTIWSKVGGDGINSSWPDGTYEGVSSLATDGTYLYAGLGSSTSHAEVWMYNPTGNTWSKLADRTTGSGAWASYEEVISMVSDGTNLYVGTGTSTGDGDLWKCANCATSPSWSQIGGDGTGWAASTYESVHSVIIVNGNTLAVGLGDGASDAAVYTSPISSISWTQRAVTGSGSGGQAWTGHGAVMSMTSIGTVLYVGLGYVNAGDADVWKCDISSSCTPTAGWTQIGGDGLNSGWAVTTDESVRALNNDGTNIYAGLGDTASTDDQIWKYNGTSWSLIGGPSASTAGWGVGGGLQNVGGIGINGTNLYAIPSGVTATTTYHSQVWQTNISTISWTQIGGDYINGSWGGYGQNSVTSSTTVSGKLYVGLGGLTGAIDTDTVWRDDGSSWTLIGAQGINNFPSYGTKYQVTRMTSYKGQLYIGLTGTAAGDAQVWMWNGSTWSQVGGSGTGWDSGTATHKYVMSMTIYNGNLVVGLGSSANGDGDIYSYNGSNWTQIEGDGLNGSPTYPEVDSMVVFGGNLYAGFGTTAANRLYMYNGSTWAEVGGNGNGSGGQSWATSANIYRVASLAVYKGNLYATVYVNNDNAQVWQCTPGCTDTTGWTLVGGGTAGVNGSWAGSVSSISNTYPSFPMAVYNGELYVGLTSNVFANGQVWKWDGSSWTQVAGASPNGWQTNASGAFSFTVFAGKLWATLGNSGHITDNVYSWGNNAVLSSTTASQDTNWHHIVASYDGTTMKIYINGTLDSSSTVGTLSIPTNTQPLYVGSTAGSWGDGKPQPFFNGALDEIRISTTARSGYQNVPYSTTPQAVTLTSAAFTSGLKEYDNLLDNETANGGTITFRLSVDNGSTWLYWNGSSWSASSSYSQANSVSVANANILSVPVTFYGIKWQAILSGNGNQQVTLNSVGINATSDTTAPTAASSILAYKANGGSSLSSNSWTNGSSPYFSWTAGTDVGGSGVKGYCLYLGQTSTADPVTTAGLLGSSPNYAGNHCQFMVTSASVDFATAGYISTAMTSSTSPYYLIIKTIDLAGNVASTATSFQLRFDNTLPTNPAYISAPSTFINTKTATLTWPTSGSSAAADDSSGIAGLQYKINNSPWYGANHTRTQDINDLLANNGSYTTVSNPDFTYIVDGTNTVYFRTWDNAGNVTTTYVTAALKVNTTGSPSEPQNVTATPTSNTNNSFAFSWTQPTTFVGNASNLTYCYTVNVLPSASTCTYTPAGVTSLGANTYATQPGSNTFYVAAKDESGNINYAAYGSTTFTANTTAPGIPTSMSIVDVSLKDTSQWRLALTWSEPSAVGSGVSTYRVYRSTDNSTFSQVGTSSSTTYIDANLSQITYYYYVKACDNANNCGAQSSTVSMLPTGRFTSPANLVSGPTVSNVSTTKATITWATDRVSDSKVAFGTASGQYSKYEVGDSVQETPHSIELTNLAAGTTYYFVVKWTDVDGNTGQSGEQTFTTLPPPQIADVSTTSIDLDSATVNFTITGAASINLYYGQNGVLGSVKNLNTSATTSSYSMGLVGLNDGSSYSYRIDSVDTEGTTYQGNVYSFSTPARPRISNLRFQPVPGVPTSTQQVTWTTNVPSSSEVSYGVVGSSPIVQFDPTLTTDHSVTISNLADASTYYLVAQSRDANGNLATSDSQRFQTALDTRPPKITNITVEPSIRGTGAEAFGQIVVSWTTDEPATSQVAYSEGSNPASFNSKTAEDTGLSTEHIVIVSNLPSSKIYTLVPMSKDKAGNQAVGSRQTTIIGHASDSVLTIILNTLQKIFGL